MKRLWIPAVAAVIALSCSSVALAASPRGTLTSKEYSLISKSEARISAAAKGKTIKWNRLLAGCTVLGSSTSLLSTRHIACLHDAAFLAALVAMPSEIAKCDTGSTQDYTCLAPAYADLATYSAQMYRADRVAVSTVVKRGFTGACRVELAGTSKELRNENKLVAATRKLSGDVNVESQIQSGQAPGGAISVAQLQTDANAFERDTASSAGSGPRGKLTVCAHQ